MKIKKKDFIEVEYTGKLKEDNLVFDTTNENLAKQSGIHGENMQYGPIVICVGEKQLLPGLDQELEGKETEKEYKIELSPENAFGKKDAKLIQLIQTSKFHKQNIQPMPGLQVNIDGVMGMIKTVSGGRTLVDFNHPLSGKDIVYDIKINKIVTDNKKKLESFLNISLNQEVKAEIKEDKAKITVKTEIPKEAQEQLNKKVSELIPSIKKLEFEIAKKEEKKDTKKPDNKVETQR